MNRRHPLPAEVYALVEREPGSVLLEGAGTKSQKPISLLFFSPLEVLQASEPSQIPALFARIEDAVGQGQMVAGFITYECGQAFEPKAGMLFPKKGRPLAWFGVYERAFVYDHATGAFCGNEPPAPANSRMTEGAAAENRQPQIALTPSINEKEFAERIAAIHESIRAGDAYQLNFTFPMGGTFSGNPAALFRAALARQPVEYAAFIHWQPGRHILSISPELFFRIEEDEAGRRITTRPMKGTAARGRTTAEDAQIADRLRNDDKNRSENVMIVDLLRNDLGRLCEFGSVRVDDLFTLERYPTVWQMASTVSGQLRNDAGFYDIFRALFPCGSVTGAPKVRAMQLLTQLEEQARGVYTGAIGYFSREKSVFNVAIRTVELDGSEASMGVGSGIVIDSIAAQEYRECLLKAEFLTRPEERFSLVETMLWDGRYPLLDLHLDRLIDSADYFGFPCQRAEVKSALLSAAAGFPDRLSRKIRLLVDADGKIRIEQEILAPEAAPHDRALRICIAPERTDPADRFLYHKTTHRPRYARAFEAASRAGYADVLFLNRDGEVTEGAISNVFIEQNGRWFTPPVKCGLLPGVYRRYLVETRKNIEERILTMDDLRRVDAIYLSNAVRGLRRVSLDWDAELSVSPGNF